MALIVDIAQAVATELSAHAFSMPFTAARYYRPVFDLADMAALHVSVVPKGLGIERLDRSRNQHDVQVDIAVQRKLQTAETAEIDALVALVEEIADFFRLRRLASCPEAVWIQTANVPIYAAEHLEELGQFTSVLTLTFRVAR
jgi:hypothetical protein